MIRFRPALFLFILFGISSDAFACSGPFDIVCNVGKTVEKAVHDVGKSVEKAAQDIGKPLTPVRDFLRADQIPPPEAGAYGLVVFKSKSTSASKSKLLMVCKAFVAFFPRNETATVPIQDRMITIWPIYDPNSEKAKADDCDFVVDNYDLNASEAAINDAKRQHATFEGEGPYLIGWSPSDTRGHADKLVLVVDMSVDNNQETIDHHFLFWKNKIVEDPSAWRSGFSVERVRIAIHDFANQYGQDMLDAIKLIGDKKP